MAGWARRCALRDPTRQAEVHNTIVDELHMVDRRGDRVQAAVVVEEPGGRSKAGLGQVVHAGGPWRPRALPWWQRLRDSHVGCAGGRQGRRGRRGGSPAMPHRRAPLAPSFAAGCQGRRTRRCRGPPNERRGSRRSSARNHWAQVGASCVSTLRAALQRPESTPPPRRTKWRRVAWTALYLRRAPRDGTGTPPPITEPFADMASAAFASNTAWTHRTGHAPCRAGSPSRREGNDDLCPRTGH